MSPSAFEAHAGAGSSRKWRVSLRHVSDGCTIGHWLEARGLHEPKPRREGRPPRAHQKGANRASHSLDLFDSLGLGGIHLLDQQQDDSLWIGSASGVISDNMVYEIERVPVGGDATVPSADMEERPQQPQQLIDQPTEVNVTCRGSSGVLNLTTWKASLSSPSLKMHPSQ